MNRIWQSAYYGTAIFILVFIANEVLAATNIVTNGELHKFANLVASLGIVGCVVIMWGFGFSVLVREAPAVEIKVSILRLMYLLIFNGLSGYYLYYLIGRGQRYKLSSAWGW